jgi:competence protein ComEC
MTHPHQDHLAGLLEVLRRYRVEQVLYPALVYASPLYEEWPRVIEEREVASVTARAGQRLDMGGGVFLEVLPFPDEPASDVDNGGLVLRLEYGVHQFLLAATSLSERDGSAPRAGALRQHGAPDRHTVADTSHLGGFLAVVNAVWRLSVGADNRYGLTRCGVLTV